MRTQGSIIAYIVGSILLVTLLLFEFTDKGIALVILAGLSIAGCLGFYLYSQRLVKSFSEAALSLAEKEEVGSVPQIAEVLKTTKLKLTLITNYIKQLGSDDETLHPLLENDQVGLALVTAREEMKRRKEEEGNQHWIAEGLAKFGDILRNRGEIGEYGSNIVSNLVRYTGVNQCGLFLAYESEEEGKYLELTASYAYERRKYEQSRVYPREGLLGQSMLEKEMIFLTDIPQDYVHITSGLGLATPRNVVIIPLLANDIFYGAIELASFQVLKKHHIEFLQRLSVNIAAEIASIKALDHTQGLLAASDQLREKLEASEEVLKENLMMLSATQEEMQRNQRQLEMKQAELNSYLGAIDNTVATVEFDMTGKILSANEIFLTISMYALENITKKSFSQISLNDDAMKLMWQNLRNGQFFSGEFKLINSAASEEWLIGTFNPILDLAGKPEKVVMIAQFITQDKEKMNYINSVVHAFKASLPMVEFNEQFQCKLANEKFLKLFDVQRVALRNKQIGDFLSEEYYKNSFEELSADILSEGVSSTIIPMKISNSVREFNTSISVIRDLHGNINRIILILVHELNDALVRLAEENYDNGDYRPRS